MRRSLVPHVLPALVVIVCAVALCAVALHAAPVNLSDAFDGKSGLTWTPLQGEWQVRDSTYHASGTCEALLQSAAFRDFQAEFDVRITDPGAILADWAGVAFGSDLHAGAGSGYLAYLRYTGQIELFQQGRILTAAQTGLSADIAAGRYVRIGVTVAGTHITVLVNGKPLLEHDAPAPFGGQVALMTCDVKCDYANFHLQGDRLQSMIMGEVLFLPDSIPVAGAKVQIYNSMDGYNSPVARETVTDVHGRYEFRDLPAGERAYWLRAGKESYGGGTAWFVTVSDREPTTADLYLIGSPRHDVFADSASATANKGFRVLDDPQCFGGSRMEVKEQRPASEKPQWQATFPFEIAREADYVPHFAAGLYPTPYYWSNFWWRVDGGPLHNAQAALTLEGDRYGDRSTLVWAYGAPLRLTKGKHTLEVVLRDPVSPAPDKDGKKTYSWSFDAAAFAELPVALAPLDGQTVATSRPELRWQAPASAARFTVQLSQEPDFSNATMTAVVSSSNGSSFTPTADLPDGVYYWRLKGLPEEETPFGSSFTAPQRFTVTTANPAIAKVRVAARTATEATITWETDEPCTSRLLYGLSGLEQTRFVAASSQPGTKHSARLTGLDAMTYYYYRPEVTSRSGHTATGLRRGFCTPRGIIADRNSPFGIFGQGLIYANQMGKAGARWYSDYWDWATLEPERGKFNWDQAEQRMKRAEDAGVNLTVTFWGSPAWVRPSHPDKFTYGPDDLQDARDFFRAVAEHCRGRSFWWLPWIEPNVARDMTFSFPEGYWANRPHARTLAAYQRAAYQGAKAGDPDCRFVGMNTAGVDLAFIRKCYDEGASDDFDVMNVHYYAMTEPFERQDPEAMFAGLRALMAEYGDTEKPIICSEGGGASSGLPGTTEQTQADNIVRIFVLSIANNIDKLCWTFELDEKPYGSTHVDMIMWMGLFRFDPRTDPAHPVGAPKPSYAAFKTMTANLAGTEYVGPVAAGPGVRAYRFQQRGRPLTVAWAESDTKVLSLPIAARQVEVTSRDGRSERKLVPRGTLHLSLTGSPVYIREMAD